MKLNTPEIRPDGGVYEGFITVRFICSGADDVYFTTDGTVPHVASRAPVLASGVAPDKTFVIDTTQKALASVSGEFTATLLCSCIVKAVGVRYGGRAGGTGREATLSPVKTSIKFGVRCATPQVDAALAIAGMSNNEVHLRCQTHGAQILYAVEGLLELPPYADRKRLRQAFGKAGWFKVENRRRLKPDLTVAEMAEDVFAEDVVQLKSTFERDPAGDVLSGVECRLYRNQQKLEVLPGTKVMIVAVREGLEDSLPLLLTKAANSSDAPVCAFIGHNKWQSYQGVSDACENQDTADSKEMVRSSEASQDSDAYASTAVGTNVVVFLVSQRREVFVYQRTTEEHTAATASDLDCFIWSALSTQQRHRPAEVALSAARSFTGYQQIHEVEHIFDRQIQGAATVSIFCAAVKVEKKGEAPFPPTKRWASGRFVPVKSLLPLLKPAAAQVQGELALLARSLGLGEQLETDLATLDPFNAHLAIPVGGLTNFRDAGGLRGGLGYFGSPALEKCTFHFPLRVVSGRPRAKPGQMVVPVKGTAASTTPQIVLQFVHKATITESRPQGIPIQRMQFMHKPPPSSSTNPLNVALALYGLNFRGDTIYAVLEAPTMTWSAVVLLRMLFQEAVLSLSTKTGAVARAVPQAAGADVKTVEEVEEEEEDEQGGAAPDMWKSAADRRKHELQQEWARLKAQGKHASRTADEHADRARYLEAQIMHCSAALIKGIHVSSDKNSSSGAQYAGNALGRTLKVVGEALDVCNGVGAAVSHVGVESEEDEL